ncbi:hypothetical protein [Nostoc sp. CHAB 5715]|nr:hypothetical protein [Nostoc sp. CHAB 5715]
MPNTSAYLGLLRLRYLDSGSIERSRDARHKLVQVATSTYLGTSRGS